ncbi:MAG: 16S rRNA (uracil1498-N3)-methyltransferase [Planctomycetota bacterium]
MATPAPSPAVLIRAGIVNFLLLEPDEVAGDGDCVIRGRRVEHLRTVLKAEVGTALRVGVINGQLGTAAVTSLSESEASLSIELHLQPSPLHDTLLLAVPRPKVLMRMLAHASAMGFARIVLFRSWRVDKSWMQSRALDPDVQREQLLLGLEQAGRTQLPELLRFDLFKPMVEDELPALDLPQPRFVAHPYAATPTHQLAGATAPGNKQPFTLALGPDGGFLPYEVDKLIEAGFHAISCGPHALRTETALAALWGQLDLLRQRQ